MFLDCIVSGLARRWSDIAMCAGKEQWERLEVAGRIARSVRDASARRVRAGNVAGASLGKEDGYRAKQDGRCE